MSYKTRDTSSSNISEQEFLCPLCHCSNNSVIPIIPHILQQPRKLETIEVKKDQILMEVSFDQLTETGKRCKEVSDTGGKYASLTPAVLPLAPSTSSARTETSAYSISSDSTMKLPGLVEDNPCCSSSSLLGKGVVKPLSIKIDFPQWLEALSLALKYCKSLEPQEEANNDHKVEDVENTHALIRHYTSSLDQVVEELKKLNHDGVSFANLYRLVEGGCEWVFPSSVYDITRCSQASYRVGLEGTPSLQ